MKLLMAIIAVFLIAVPLAEAYETRVNFSVWNSTEQKIAEYASMGNDGKYAVVAYSWVNDTVPLYDVSNGQKLWTHFTPQYSTVGQRITRAVTSDNGKTTVVREVTRDYRRIVVLMDRNSTPAWTYNVPANVEPREAEQILVDATDDGAKIVLVYSIAENNSKLGGVSGEVIVFDAETKEVLWSRSFSNPLNRNFLKVKITNDGKKVLVEAAHLVYVYDKDKILFEAILPSPLDCCVGIHSDISDDGKYVAIGGSEFGTVELYEFNNGVYSTKWFSYTNKDSIRYLALSKDGSTLAVGASDWSSAGGSFGFYSDSLVLLYSTDLWPISTNRPPIWIYSNYGHGGGITSIDLSADGSRIVVGAYGSSNGDKDVLTVFNKNSNVPIIKFTDDSDSLGSVKATEISDNGKTIFVVGYAGHPYIGGSKSTKLLGLQIQ